jgi:hypothetical protein
MYQPNKIWDRRTFRVARWHIFKPKIPIWANFGRSCNGQCWYVGICYSYLVYFTAIGYNLLSFGIFYDYLVYCMIIWYIVWLFGIFYDYLVYFMIIWYISWLFGIFYDYLVYFPPFWYLLLRQIWQLCGHLRCERRVNKAARFYRLISRTRVAPKKVGKEEIKTAVSWLAPFNKIVTSPTIH